jgi:hypothetical protein
MAHVKGEFTCFLDADDLIPSDKVTWQVDYLLQHPAVGVIGGSHEAIGATSAPKRDPNSVIEDWSFERIVTRNPFISPGVALLRTEVIRKVGGFDQRLWATDDWDYWIRIAKHASVRRSQRVALSYRVHTGNLSGNTERMLAACSSLIREHLSTLPPETAAPLWKKASHHLYDGLGSMLVSRARHAVGRGRLVKAAALLAGLRPLAREIISDRVLRRAVVQDLLGH